MDLDEEVSVGNQAKIDVIQAINRETVHKICSGQVLFTMLTF